MDKIVFASVCAAVVVIMLIYHLTRKHRLRSFIYGAATGLAALILLSHFGSDFNAELPLNLFNISGSVILGVPFVICEVLLKLL